MKKKVLVPILCALLLGSCTGVSKEKSSSPASSSEEASSSQATTAAYKVLVYLEGDDGEFTLDETKTQELTGTIGEEVTATPAEIDGYTCISSGDELKVVVNENGTAAVELQYRKNYTIEVVERAHAFFAEGETATPVGDKISLTRTGEGPVEVVIAEEMIKSSVASEEPNTLEVTIEYNGKEYVFSYTYTVQSAALAEKIATGTADYLKGVLYQANMGIYDWNQTYQIDVYKDGPEDHNVTQYDLLQVPAFKTLYDNLVLDVTANPEEADTKIADFQEAAVAAYETWMLDNLIKLLKDWYSTLNFGVFAGNGGKVNVGDPQADSANDRWIYVDPTAELTGGDTTHDIREYTPACFKGENIVAFIESLRGTLTSYDAINQIADKIAIDIAASAYLAISEAEAYYAMKLNNGVMTVSGDSNASVWWFMWTMYSGASFTFKYLGPQEFDDTTVTNYRLCGAIFDETNAAYGGWNLTQVLTMGNWVIAHQVDDMFAPAA